MRILVRGAGSIGLRHIKNAIALGHEVWANDLSNAALVAAAGAGAHVLGTFPTFAAAIDATPATARAAAQVPTLFEKPLATSADAARRLDRASVSSAVGFQLRFLPAIAELKDKIGTERLIFARVWFSQDLRQWRPGDYRQSVSAQKKLGGGIVNEASHELDLIRHLFGEWSWVQGWTQNSGRLEIDVEDVASALVGLVDGGVVELHLDMVQTGYGRGVEILTDRGDYSLGLDFMGSERERNQPYVDELSAFLKFVRTGDRDPRLPTLEDGVAACELADAIKESSRTGGRVFNGSESEYSIERLYR